VGKRYAEIAVNSTFPHWETFSYAVPESIDARPGHAAYVPFGRLTLQGIIVEAHDTPVFSPPEKIRPLRSLIGERPLLDEDRIALAKWVAARYIAPIFSAVALMLPPGFERQPRTVVRPLVDPAEIDGLGLPDRPREALEAIVQAGETDIDALREALGAKQLEALLAQLEKQDLIVREYTLAPPRISYGASGQRGGSCRRTASWSRAPVNTISRTSRSRSRAIAWW